MEQKDLRPGTEGTGNLPVVLALPLGTRTTCMHVRAYLSFISMRLDLVGLGGKWEKKRQHDNFRGGDEPKALLGSPSRPCPSHSILLSTCQVFLSFIRQMYPDSPPCGRHCSRGDVKVDEEPVLEVAVAECSR